MKRSLLAGALLTFIFCLTVRAQEQTAPKTGKVGVSYGLVIDNSGSVRTLLDKIISLTTEIVAANGPEDEAFLVTFVDTPKIVLRQEFTYQKAELNDSVQNMFIEGGQTAILDAVRISAEYLVKNASTDGPRLRALIVVTDGEDRESGSKIDDVVKTLKEQNIRVFVIAVSEGKIVAKLIDRLTKETGGMKFSPKTRPELSATAAQISAAIRAK